MSNKYHPWRNQYLIFGSPYIGSEEREEVLACIDSCWLGTGPRVQQLEKDFKSYIQAKHAVAVSSCTAALHLALNELHLEPDSEVITTAMTFCATANAIVHAGLKPVFADCERDTMNIDPVDVERKISPRTRAIIPVHFAGRPCDMKAIMALAARHKLHVIEDCAHAIEATIDGQHCGTFGEFGCFSFYVTKNMTTVEGGMVVCKEQKGADRVKIAALHGLSQDAWHRFSDQGYVHYEVLEPGFKYNMTDIAASFGIHQLARLEKMYNKRKQLWNFYIQELKELPLVLPIEASNGMRHGMHLFTCLVTDENHCSRDHLIKALHELRIGSGVHYTALHRHPYYRKKYGYGEGSLPNAEYIGGRTFSIPFSGKITEDDARDVVRALKLILK